MINYGCPPASDDVEVIVFGPGYGEAIAIHLGEGDWMLVDSCMDPHSKKPAALTYLDSIGVPYTNVSSIVASHWHDDHVKGISTIVRSCTKAEVNISAAFNNEEAMTFVATYNGKSSAGMAGGSRELFDVLSGNNPVFHAHKRSSIRERISHGHAIRVSAMSPVDAALGEMVYKFGSLIPSMDGTTPMRKAVSLKPNIESVAVHVDFGTGAILLGSDLEEHSTLGWSAVVADAWSQKRRKADAYKIAHHGSYTGDSPSVWTTLLSSDPVLVATPFVKGRHRLPTEEDRARIRSKSSSAFISSGAARRAQMDAQVLKRLGDISKSVRQVNNGFGAVRLRRKLGGSTWAVECFGDACAI